MVVPVSGEVTEYCSAPVARSLSSDGSLVVVAGGGGGGGAGLLRSESIAVLGSTEVICACAAGPASISPIEATAATAILVSAFRIYSPKNRRLRAPQAGLTMTHPVGAAMNGR